MFLIIFISTAKINLPNEINEIGNEFTDTNICYLLLNNISDNIDEEYINEIIKILNESNLFSYVSVKL